jgi:F-type H+-transporting ATPase subunit a
MSAAFHMAFLGPVIAILAPAVFMALHVFVSLLQAYIFMLLPAVYIGMAVSEEH